MCVIMVLTFMGNRSVVEGSYDFDFIQEVKESFDFRWWVCRKFITS